MIRHAVLITVKPDTPPDAIDRLVEAARGLPFQVPFIRDWQVGVGLNPRNATVGIVGTFDDLDGFAQYMSHPAHHECAQTYIVPFMESGTQVQFEIQERVE
jgi:hypothetical protein